MSPRTDGLAEMGAVATVVTMMQRALQRTEVRETGRAEIRFRQTELARPVRCIVEQAIRCLNGDIRSVRWFEDGAEMVLRVVVNRE